MASETIRVAQCKGPCVTALLGSVHMRQVLHTDQTSRAGNAAPALTAIGCGKDGILAAARGKTAILGWMATTVNNS